MFIWRSISLRSDKRKKMVKRKPTKGYRCKTTKTFAAIRKCTHNVMGRLIGNSVLSRGARSLTLCCCVFCPKLTKQHQWCATTPALALRSTWWHLGGNVIASHTKTIADGVNADPATQYSCSVFKRSAAFHITSQPHLLRQHMLLLAKVAQSLTTKKGRLH